jgi:hypothetical protein
LTPFRLEQGQSIGPSLLVGQCSVQEGIRDGERSGDGDEGPMMTAMMAMMDGDRGDDDGRRRAMMMTTVVVGTPDQDRGSQIGVRG